MRLGRNSENNHEHNACTNKICTQVQIGIWNLNSIYKWKRGLHNKRVNAYICWEDIPNMQRQALHDKRKRRNKKNIAI